MTETSPRSPISKFVLFVGTFVSSFLLIMGIGLLLLMFIPAWASALLPITGETPQLPLSETRDDQIIPVETYVGKQLYPPLVSLADVQTGNWIHIPSIGVHVPLALSASIQDKDVLAILDQGAALYPNGILPGRVGNVFIAAHSTGEPWKGKYRFAFLKINEIKPGNVINLDYKGARYTYRVVSSDLVHPSPDFVVISDRPVPTVTLMACWPLWSTKQRMLIKAELTNVTKLTPTPA